MKGRSYPLNFCAESPILHSNEIRQKSNPPNPLDSKNNSLASQLEIPLNHNLEFDCDNFLIKMNIWNSIFFTKPF